MFAAIKAALLNFLREIGFFLKPCSICKGTGKVTEWYSQVGSMKEGHAVVCRSCQGKGKTK